MVDKSKKYDRQLRLWETHGQVLLERASILLLGVSPSALEALKNLILPGAGSFTIHSDLRITPSLQASSFFATRRPRQVSSASSQNSQGNGGPDFAAKVAVERLRELNEDVHGKAVCQSANSFEATPDTLKAYAMIFIASATTLSADAEASLLNAAWQSFTPVISLQSSGLTGLMGISLRQHAIMDPHAENVKDLRLDRPWKELRDYVDQYPDFASLKSDGYAHIPYPIILMRMRSGYEKEHGNPPPNSDTFKAYITTNRRSDLTALAGDDGDNFEEATRNAFRALPGHTKIPKQLADDFFPQLDADKMDAEHDRLPEVTRKFWVLMRALRHFVEGAGELPLVGRLPDMKAATSEYVELQRIYSAKAGLDMRVFKSHLAPDADVSDREIQAFCRNCAHVSLLSSPRPSSLLDAAGMDERTTGVKTKVDEEEMMKGIPGVPGGTHASLYMALRAMQEVSRQRPEKAPTEDDVLEKFKGIWKVDDLIDTQREWCREVVRCLPTLPMAETETNGDVAAAEGEAHELAATAAWLGGMAGQEALKVLTHQYTPAVGTVVLDAVHSSVGVLPF